MNQKAYSVLFCALLASTFVHELRAKGVGPVSSHLEVLERAATTEICTLECTFQSNVSISFGLTIEVVNGILVIANISANAALLIDVSAQIVVVLNGTSGAGVAIDIVAQTGVYIQSGLWVAASTSLEVFIGSLSGGLRAIFSITAAIKFSVSSVPTAILVVINQIIVRLVIGIGAELLQDVTLGLQILLAVSVGLIGLLNGVLSGLLGLITGLVIHITNDIVGFLNLLQGFAAIVLQVAGSLAALIEKGVVFDLALIFGAANGLVVFINIILQIGIVLDIGVALGGILNSAESLFTLIAQLGGNIVIGISGVFLVVAEIVALVNTNATLEVVISTIIEFVAVSSVYVTTDLTVELNATLGGLLAVVKQINATAAFGGLITIVEALVAGTFIFGKVNISLIIQKLLVGVIAGVSALLGVVAFVVLQLQVIVEVGKLIPFLLLVLIFKLNSAIGITLLIALGINIQVNLGGIIGGILKFILSGIVSLIIGLLTGNFYDALAQLPVIGTIIVALNVAIGAASGGAISLKALLNVSALVKGLILGLIQFVTGIYLGISASIIAQVTAILGETASVGGFLRLNITLSAAVSVSG